jgi:hypothetical protein
MSAIWRNCFTSPIFIAWALNVPLDDAFFSSRSACGGVVRTWQCRRILKEPMNHAVAAAEEDFFYQINLK